MSWRLLHDYGDGLQEWFYQDPETKKITIRVTQDVEDVVKSNAEKRATASSNWKGNWHEVAAVPEVVKQAWWQEMGGDPFSKENLPKTMRRLNSRDWYKLRTKEGKL